MREAQLQIEKTPVAANVKTQWNCKASIVTEAIFQVLPMSKIIFAHNFQKYIHEQAVQKQYLFSKR